MNSMENKWVSLCSRGAQILRDSRAQPLNVVQSSIFVGPQYGTGVDGGAVG